MILGLVLVAATRASMEVFYWLGMLDSSAVAPSQADGGITLLGLPDASPRT